LTWLGFSQLWAWSLRAKDGLVRLND
jgi:hypothetical protein